MCRWCAQALLDLLKQSLDQSLNVNLAVAGVVCSLVADPAEPIRRALLAPLDGLSQSSLQSVLPAVRAHSQYQVALRCVVSEVGAGRLVGRHSGVRSATPRPQTV